MEHSKLPWSIEYGFAVVDANRNTVAAFSAAYPEGEIEIDKDDAEFIVTACNAHAGLVESARLALAFVHGFAMAGADKDACDYVMQFVQNALKVAGVDVSPKSIRKLSEVIDFEGAK